MGLQGWRADVASHESREVAGRLGVTGCPVCRAEPAVERRDRAGSVRWRRDGGWTCHACDAGGDALALVLAVAVGRHRSTSGEDWRRAEDLAVSCGLVTREETRIPTGTPIRARSRPIDRYRPISVREQAIERLARQIADLAWARTGEPSSWWLRHGAREQARREDRAAEVDAIEARLRAAGACYLVPLGFLLPDDEIERIERIDPHGLRVAATFAEWRAVFDEARRGGGGA